MERKNINRGFTQSLPVHDCRFGVQAGIVPTLLTSLMRSIALLSKFQHSNIPIFQYSKVTTYYPEEPFINTKMKNFLSYIVIFLLFSSCIKQEPDYSSLSVELTIEFSEDIPYEHRDSAKVVLANLTKNYSFTKYATSEGYVLFNGIEPGFYSATVVHSYSESGTSFHLNGLKLIDVFSSIADTIPLIISESNALVIKEFYYSGCLTPAGNQYTSDQYIEIFNNSSMLQYADGISIMEHESYSLDENYWTFLKDTIVARMIWTIPGEGNDVPILPGRSIVIARDAINHQDDSLGNPLCPVDLSFADFEFWVKTVTGGDIDGPFSINMIEDLFTFRGSDVCFHTRGGSAIALVKFPGNSEDRENFINNNLIRKVATSTRYYGKIPNEFVLDAVEVTWDEAHAIYKRFPLELDAGYTYVAAGSRSGKCIRRKVKEIIDGRYVYQDTNNSSEDFLKDADPNPWIYEE